MHECSCGNDYRNFSLVVESLRNPTVASLTRRLESTIMALAPTAFFATRFT
jgi:hypothetical protein